MFLKIPHDTIVRQRGDTIVRQRGKAWYLSGAASESTGLATQAAMGEDLGSNDFIKAGVKSFMVSPLGSATGSAAEGVFKSSVVGEAVSAGYSNGMGELTDYHMQE